VASVAQIYNYFKKSGYSAPGEGRKHRKVDQIGHSNKFLNPATDGAVQFDGRGQRVISRGSNNPTSADP